MTAALQVGAAAGGGSAADPAAAATFREALDSVFAMPAYRWAEAPPLLHSLRDGWNRLGQWLQGIRADNPAAFQALIAALLGALALVVVHGLWVVWRTVRRGGVTEGERSPVRASAQRDSAWYLREADFAAADGRMAAALQLAFIGLALSLEGQGLLRYHASSTPAECVRQARLGGPDRDRLRALVRTLYAHVFGGGPFGPDDYRRWREELARPWHAPAG